MNERILTETGITAFQKYLIMEEKSTATVEKYLRDVRAFFVYVGNMEITKEKVMDIKKH